MEVVRSRITCDRAGRYSSGVIAALSSIIKQEGPLALYTGVGSSLAAIMPEAAITYGLFDLITKEYTKSTNKEKPGVAVAVAAGVVASCLGQTVSFPLETISRRLQVGAANGAKASVSRTVQRIVQERGLAGFYQGFQVGVLRAVPMSALSFGTYELVRAWLSIQSGSFSNNTVQSQNSEQLKST